MIKRFYLAMIIGLVGFMAAQSTWPLALAQDKANTKEETQGTKIRIHKEEGPTGHQTIGIDEDSLVVDSHKELHLTFRALMKWEYDVINDPSPPETIKKLHDSRVRLVGFMYPLQEGANIRYFCLLRTTQTCCYGPRPQYNQYVFVEMAEPTKFFRLDPVSCVGKLKVDPSPDDGFIYRIEGESCNPVNNRRR